MVLLSPKLNLKVSQKQILTPGLVQMVSVLALNKIELKDMINAEMVENPVLEELDGSVPLLDDIAHREEERDRAAQATDTDTVPAEKKDSFDEIDFGSFFQDYLDPGYRTSEGESIERPSFENFLSKPSTLTDHLMWQLGSMSMREEVRRAAELVIGNLSEDGYLIASDEELMSAGSQEALRPVPEATPAPEAATEAVGGEFTETGDLLGSARLAGPSANNVSNIGLAAFSVVPQSNVTPIDTFTLAAATTPELEDGAAGVDVAEAAAVEARAATAQPLSKPLPDVSPLGFTLADLRDGVAIVQQMDPIGVAARNLGECLLAQLQFHQQQSEDDQTDQIIADAIVIASEHLRALQNKQLKEISKSMNRPLEAVQKAVDLIRSLDPRPGLRYNKVEPRLIEPDVAFIKQGDEYLCVLNDDDVPQLRLNTSYKKLLNRDAAEKDVRNYVKERYKSAIQLIKNIEQRKQTIMKVCYAIVGRQKEFLDRGIDQLKPMMIKEVAEEIGVHPSTVSRAVANKYAHTPQGVYELRYFFSESVNGPEGGNTSLLILKRRVKKLIGEEDASRPLTDEQITRILQSQGIQVTRRTVAKYREDMGIPSTHHRRVKN
jgi:RNA polymerase sigma-54 factor